MLKAGIDSSPVGASWIVYFNNEQKSNTNRLTETAQIMILHVYQIAMPPRTIARALQKSEQLHADSGVSVNGVFTFKITGAYFRPQQMQQFRFLLGLPARAGSSVSKSLIADSSSPVSSR